MSKKNKTIENAIININNNNYLDIISNNNKIKKSKILPIKYPLFNANQMYASIIAIISNYEDAMSWVYNYFINIQLNRKLVSPLLTFTTGRNYGYNYIQNCPFLKYHGLTREFLVNKWKFISDFLIECINSDYYIYLKVDTFFMPKYIHYQKRHEPHPLMVYGYDLEKRVFHISDNIVVGKFSLLTCSFEEIEDAFRKVDLYIPKCYTDTILFKYNSEHVHRFDISFVKNLLNDYLNSKDSNYRFGLVENSLDPSQWAFGMEVYNVLQQYIQNTIENKYNLDIRHFCGFSDHKKMLLMLIKYLTKEFYLNPAKAYLLIETFEECANTASQIVYLAIKYNVSKNIKILYRILDKLEYMEKKELSVINELISNINKKKNLSCIKSQKINSLTQFNGEWEEKIENNKKIFISNTHSAYCSLFFYGTEVEYYAKIGMYFGKTNIFIDDFLDCTINLFSDTRNSVEKVYARNNLKLGYHTIKICPSNNKNDPIINTLISFESFKCYNRRNYEKIDDIASFISYDLYTKGNWHQKYGKAGYDIITAPSKDPNYAKITYSKFYRVTNLPRNNDSFLRKKNYGDKLSMEYSSYKPINVEIIIAGDILKKVSIYFLNWSKDSSFALAVEISDVMSNKILDYRKIEANDIELFKAFCNGLYLNYMIKGHVIIKISSLTNSPAFFSGIFFE